MIHHAKLVLIIFSFEQKQPPSQSKYNLTHLQSERTISFLTGLRACRKQRAFHLQPAEVQCKNLLDSPIFAGGLQILQPANPFDEEKGDARSCASTTSNTPTEVSNKLMDLGIMPKSVWPQVVRIHISSFIIMII